MIILILRFIVIFALNLTRIIMGLQVYYFLTEVFKTLPSSFCSCPIRIFNADSFESLRIEICVGNNLTLEILKSLFELPYVELKSLEGSILVIIYSSLH